MCASIGTGKKLTVFRSAIEDVMNQTSPASAPPVNPSTVSGNRPLSCSNSDARARGTIGIMTGLNGRLKKLENLIGYLAAQHDDVEGWARLIALASCKHTERYDYMDLLVSHCPITGEESDVRTHPYREHDLKSAANLISKFRHHRLEPSMTAMAQLEYIHSQGDRTCPCVDSASHWIVSSS